MKNNTLGFYLVNKILPKGIQINKPLTDKYLDEILLRVHKEYPELYPDVVSNLTRLGAKFATYESITIGLDEIKVPNRAKRDKAIKDADKVFNSNASVKDKNKAAIKLQRTLGEIEVEHNNNDSATEMINVAMRGKRTQLQKLRTTPGIVGDSKGEVVFTTFPKSYAEGQDPLQFVLGAVEARANAVISQTTTSSPGELSKVMSNIMNACIVSEEDCFTDSGISLPVISQEIIGRYSQKSGGLQKNTKIDPSIQESLIRKKLLSITVRSPQTCEAPQGTVCVKCMGIRSSTGKPFRVGDNVGMLAAGSMGNPLTQMPLSKKHSTTTATESKELEGEKGFRKLVEMPSNYPMRKIYAEIFGEVLKIIPAPQGGKLIEIRRTRPSPDKYIELGIPIPKRKGFFQYYIPPTVKILEGIEKGTKVFPGMELTTGQENLKDAARLRSIGGVRTKFVDEVAKVYKNSGNTLDRRWFELLARNVHAYVKLESVPSSFPWVKGEVIGYEALKDYVKSRQVTTQIDTKDALGMTLGKVIGTYTIGTPIDEFMIDEFKKKNIQRIDIIKGLVLSPHTTPMTRVLTQSSDFLSKLNSREIKSTLTKAVTYGHTSDIHGFNPINAYAYGVEMKGTKQEDEGGRY